MAAEVPEPDRDEHDVEPIGDPTDVRMADLLASTTNTGEMRRRLQGDATEGNEDLLGRINALEFVGSLVGEVHDMPEQLGGYRIEGLLGRGGMGTVYQAFQEQLERVVALKVLAPSWTSHPTMRERFRAEARATAALHHRHIVPIYDYGEAQGCLYFAMEKVDGQSLDKVIASARRQGRPSMAPLDAARRFSGVADALGLAHRRRILHRDVKPGNLMVSTDGTLALTDFGLAKALDRASVHLTSMSGGFLGTLHYSSPEQALGRETTPASDLYSLGVTMFEAVTGELPTEGRTTEAVLHSILEGRPRRLRHFLPRPPRDLELVIDKLLCKVAADRYQDGEALARDLQRIADGEPVHIRRQSLLVVLWRRARKNPVLAGAMIAMTVLLLATVVLWSGLRKERGRGLLSSHQNLLVQIANEVKREPGPPGGPPVLLSCLSGLAGPRADANPAVLAMMDQASKELPDDPAPSAMRAVYLEDPLPTATELLRQGRGFEATQALGSAIEAALGESTGNLAPEMSLYRLYLARAVANLTASVGSLTAARMDLALASFLRRGATFPRLLGALLDVAVERPVKPVLERLRRELGDSPGEQKLAMGLLLRTLAGLEPGQKGNLMAFPFEHADRRAIHDLACGWITGSPGEVGGSGLDAQLAATAKNAVTRSGSTVNLQQALEGGRTILQTNVHPDAPLQCWRVVFHLLDTGASGPPVDATGRELAPALQLQGWARLMELLAVRDLEKLQPRFDTLRKENVGLPGMTAVAARFHALLRDDQHEKLAARWVSESPDDPDALLCRMDSHLRNLRIDRAMDDAMAAVQSGVDQKTVALAVAHAFREAAAALRAPEAVERRQRLETLAQAFTEAGS